ncbi:MAG: hypothetical protein BWY69_00690 [Planctomycetes bacterium ADurb.Bin401]|nr:MAG: hypothetical protein BWY69_00690 [Planctomycetes bacterium ADurb.Bin401]
MTYVKIGIALKTANLFFILILLNVICGCQTSQRIGIDGMPMKNARLRWGAFFGSPFGMRFTDPDNLGKHYSNFRGGEKNGMLYTCRGGFIDVGHVREAADRTAFVKEFVQCCLLENKSEFSFNVIEPSKYFVKISYPSDWQNYSKETREAFANEVAIDIGQYVAHTSLIWHEIITWFGFATVAGFPDKISSFSWEDSYSDVLGTVLGAAALRQTNQTYDEAMTRLMDEEMKLLEVQSPQVARKAANAIKGKWYTGGMYYFVKMKKHNFDVGFDDGMVAPVRVPGFCYESEPKLYDAPKLQSLWKHGFGFSVEIEPRIIEKNKIYSLIGLEKNKLIKPNIHFARVIEHLENRSNLAYSPKSKKKERNGENVKSQ